MRVTFFHAFFAGTSPSPLPPPPPPINPHMACSMEWLGSASIPLLAVLLHAGAPTPHSLVLSPPFESPPLRPSSVPARLEVAKPSSLPLPPSSTSPPIHSWFLHGDVRLPAAFPQSFLLACNARLSATCRHQCARHSSRSQVSPTAIAAVRLRWSLAGAGSRGRQARARQFPERPRGLRACEAAVKPFLISLPSITWMRLFFVQVSVFVPRDGIQEFYYYPEDGLLPLGALPTHPPSPHPQHGTAHCAGQHSTSQSRRTSDASARLSCPSVMLCGWWKETFGTTIRQHFQVLIRVVYPPPSPPPPPPPAHSQFISAATARSS